MLRVANIVAAIALALFAAYFWTGVDNDLHPARYGDFGLTLDGARVWAVAPRSSADRAGIEVGDTIDRPRTLADRVRLDAPNLAGERITIVTRRSNEARTVTLESQPSPATFGSRLTGFLIIGGAVVFVALGLLLVLVRPSRMTWAFYFLALAISLVNSSPVFTGTPEWSVAYARIENVIVMIAVPGTLTFAARFPTNAATGWRRRVDDLAPYLILPGIAVLVWHDELQLNLVPGHLVSRLGAALVAFDSSIGVAATVVLFLSYLAARGLDRYKIQWVMLGWTCAIISGVLAGIYTFVLWFSIPDWLSNPLSLLFVVLPITVAYAILRHRVIDIRFVLTRSVTVGLSVALVALAIVGIDWLFSTTMPTSRWEAAMYALVILLIGFFLNAMRSRLVRLMDMLLFPQWHRTQEGAEILGDGVRRANSETALYEPLTAGIAKTFSLASAALFERVEDGGFQRVAAYGWARGTLWHILPDDPLVLRAGRTLQIADADELQWQNAGLPGGAARPARAIPISSGARVAAVLLLGAHSSGTGLDRDELRIIRRLCDDAALLYRARTTRAKELAPAPSGVA